jgi:hypothetical protein
LVAVHAGNRTYHGIVFRRTHDVDELVGRARLLPTWFTQRFEARYQSTQLFDANLPAGFALQPLPAGRPEVLVSTPERALLELLSDVGNALLTSWCGLRG